MSRLEALRQKLEEIECWEKACLQCSNEIAKRDSKRRRCLLWQHRLKSGVESLHEVALAADKTLTNDHVLIRDELRKVDAKDDTTFWNQFYGDYEELKHKNRLNTGSLQCIDDGGASLTVSILEKLPSLTDTVFTADEMRGHALDLTEEYGEWLNWKSYKAYRIKEYRAHTCARLKKLRFEKLKHRHLKAAKVHADTDDPLPPPPKLEDVVLDVHKDPELQAKLNFVESDYGTYLRDHLCNLRSIPLYLKYNGTEFLQILTRLNNYFLQYYLKLHPFAISADVKNKMKSMFVADRLPNLQYTSTKDTYCVFTDHVLANVNMINSYVNSKKYLKNAASLDGTALVKKSQIKDVYLYFQEFVFSTFVDQVHKKLLASSVNEYRKKQSRMHRELYAGGLQQNSDEDDLASEPSSDDDSDEEAFNINTLKVKNPLKLPLGWNNEPIPYWLYKLHGLSHTFVCEICGNQKYYGRKVFEEHFREWRHAFGMKCLKIPNTLHFKDITKIQDALDLYEKLKTQTETQTFYAEQEIEIEDTQGNVMTLQTLDDLKRQGLV